MTDLHWKQQLGIILQQKRKEGTHLVTDNHGMLLSAVSRMWKLKRRNFCFNQALSSGQHTPEEFTPCISPPTAFKEAALAAGRTMTFITGSQHQQQPPTGYLRSQILHVQHRGSLRQKSGFACGASMQVAGRLLPPKPQV